MVGTCLTDAPTTIMDIPDDCLNFIFLSFGDCAEDKEAFGLTCRRWLQIQNMNRRSLEFQCSLAQQRITPEVMSRRSVDVGTTHLSRLLTRFPNLTSLSLSGCTSLVDSSLVDVQHCISKLRALVLDCCSHITDVGFSSFTKGCPLLRCISLYRCNVTDVGLECIAEACTALENVNISYCRHISDLGVNAVIRNCPQLCAIRVSNCWDIIGSGFVGCSPALAYLEAYSCSLKPQGIKAMVSGGGLVYLDISQQGWSLYRDDLAYIGGGLGSKLRYLNMRLCRNVGDESIEAIAKGCPLLEEWNLALCHGIMLSGWEAVGKYCHCLVKLYIYRCRHICNDGLMALRNCRKLSVLYMSGCSRVTSVAVEQFRMVRADIEINGEEIVTVGPAWTFQW